MSDAPSQELLESVATDLAVDPSFIEKDWHATQIIARIAERNSTELAPVLSGGTSLSKGFGLIQRFSEDIDFKLLLPSSGIDRDARRDYRAVLVDAIRANAAWALSKDHILVADQGHFLATRTIPGWSRAGRPIPISPTSSTRGGVSGRIPNCPMCESIT